MGTRKSQKKSQVVNKSLLSILISSSYFLSCSKIALSDAPAAASKSSVESTATPPIKDPVPVLRDLLQPTLQVLADPATVNEGQQSHVTITFQNTENVHYACKDPLSQTALSSGVIKNSGEILTITVNRDIVCEVEGQATGTLRTVMAQQEITVACGNRVKNISKNLCEDFSCQRVVELNSQADLLDIPARDSQGLCYAIKILDHMNNGSSTLTTSFDSDVISRNHDHGVANRPNQNEHPYNMGSVLIPFKINGARVVKLSGGLSATAPILVDNFVVIGVRPTGLDITGQISSVYKVYGSSDSTLIDSKGAATENISVLGTLIPVIPFATGGTSSIAPVDVTRQVQPNVMQTLDVRALDCGGARELSNIYLLFQ